MSECWVCSRCGGMIPGALPAFLVVSGTFAAQSATRRTFMADGGARYGLCYDCGVWVRDTPPAPPPEPPRVCATCRNVLKQPEDGVVLCRECEAAKKTLLCNRCGTDVSDPALVLCPGCEVDRSPLEPGVEVML